MALFAAIWPVPNAGMRETLHVAFPVAETGFDPQTASDTYSFAVVGAIFDPLCVYDYRRLRAHERPICRPQTGRAMPPSNAHARPGAAANSAFV